MKIGFAYFDQKSADHAEKVNLTVNLVLIGSVVVCWIIRDSVRIFLDDNFHINLYLFFALVLIIGNLIIYIALPNKVPYEIDRHGQIKDTLEKKESKDEDPPFSDDEW